jgi:hypothetical protein
MSGMDESGDKIVGATRQPDKTSSQVAIVWLS